MKVGNNLLDTNAWAGVKKVCYFKLVILSILILYFKFSRVRERDRYWTYFFTDQSYPNESEGE